MPTALRIEVLSPWQLYFGLRGRIDRATFWHGVWVLTWVTLVLVALLEIAGWPYDKVGRRVHLVLLWPCIALAVKRWHDRDHSAWWGVAVLVLLMFLPRGAWVGWLWLLLDNGTRPGSPGVNRFGAPPEQDIAVRRRQEDHPPGSGSLSTDVAVQPDVDKYGLPTSPPSDPAKPASPA